MQIVINSIVEYLSEDLKVTEILRVLWIDNKQENAVVVSIDNPQKLSYPYFVKCEDILSDLSERMCRLTELEVDMRIVSPDEDYLNKYKENRDRRWNLIKDIVQKEPDIYLSKSRGRLIEEAHLASGKPKKVIRDNLLKYWFYGKSINGLLNNYFDCGIPGKERVYKKKTGPKTTTRPMITEADKEIFKSAINVFHIRLGMNITKTHERMCETYYKRGYYRKYGVRVPIVNPDESPSLRQFRYWYNNEYPKASQYRNKYGKRRATMDTRPMVEDASEKAICVGAVFEVDATKSDILLVSFDRKTILGKPLLYVVMDVFSRLVAGFHVSLSNASWFESMVAAENAATDKVEFCARYGIQISEEDWPCHYLPRNLVGDRGELKAQLSERFVNIGVDVLNAPSYRGDLKPFIESNFHITNETIRQLLSGSTEAGALERGDYNPAKESAWTIEEFNHFLIVYFLTYNKSALSKEFTATKDMFTDQVELTPLSVWKWSKGKRLLHQRSKDELRYNLLPRASAKVSRRGIEYRGLNYTCSKGIEEGWFVGNGLGVGGKTDIEITYDPRSCSSIFFKYGKELLQCLLTGKSKEFEGLHFDEVDKIMEYRDNQIKEQEKQEKQHRAELHAFTAELDKSATEKTKEATKDVSFYSRNQNKRETRTADSKVWGAMGAMTSVSLEPVSADKDSTTNEDNIIQFPTSNDLNENALTTEEDRKSLYSRKIQEKRKRDAADE
ncbi:transposase [Paenibacillus sp. FSL R5-0636]|uniref:transposase n=1 Tax=Paenibacillus TaxID=44249 RepID=UPI00096CF4D8|nr:transposase [Paenibacillus odorifer]OMD04127.1 transposase [Paenibacillus odorifer]